MAVKILKWNSDNDGKVSESKLRRKLESLGFSVSKYTYMPGTYFPDHAHENDKMDAVLSGQFRMTTPEGAVVLESGDCFEVPRGTVHSAEVIGDEPVVSLDAIRMK